jgi:hypothetical protein
MLIEIFGKIFGQFGLKRVMMLSQGALGWQPPPSQAHLFQRVAVFKRGGTGALITPFDCFRARELLILIRHRFSGMRPPVFI